VNYCDMNIQKLGVDLLSMSGSKIYGPKSTAILYKKGGIPFSSPLRGGEQEREMRPGTEDIAGIAGFTESLEITLAMREKESARLKELQNYFFNALRALSDEMKKDTALAAGESEPIRFNGSLVERLPNNVHISVPNIIGERLVIELDAYGICASSKAACQSNEEGESYVVQSLYPDSRQPAGSVRFSMGRETKKKDIDRTIEALRGIFEKVEKEKNV
jgi:cysteine desulfurase